MSIKPLITLPNPLLRKISHPVAIFDDRIRCLAEDMLDTMYHALGIGLAAIQIGEPVRLLVVDIADETQKKPCIIINPQIIWYSEERSIHREGCLSIPDYYADIERPAQICVCYYNLDGKKQEVEAHGLLATCIQHEINHLDGVLFVDHLSRLKRDIVIRKFTKRIGSKKTRRAII